MKNRKILTRTRLEALVIIVGVLGYIRTGLDLPPFYNVPGVPGPSVFPTILGLIMGLGALWLLIFPGDDRGAEQETPGESLWQRLLNRWQFYFMWALLIAYVFLLPYLGFILCSIVLLSALIFLLGERRWYLGISVAVVFTIAIYLTFSKGLQIRLPMGIFEGIIR
ncbi:MAG: tripartite tricarboxylate transporter TctB family protein [Deltaproteobacteria bacterium]|nr:tripartite tricarboxylate transporter TctB family protein [Deltaproteobacteria bacterium]MBW2070073.1 tripartite tricarboxylate transporter TctB family protein [Deltaproteobacteria bacterium]